MSQTEQYYREHALSDCKVCDGRGMIRYHWEVDTTTTAPCPKCFPGDERAKETDARWWRYVR